MPPNSRLADAPIDRPISGWVLYLPFAVIIALHLIGSFFPGYWTWGFDMWSIFPPFVPFVLVACYLLASIPVVSDRLFNAGASLVDGVGKLYGRIPRWVSVLCISALLLTLFYVFRSRALLYGDGYIVLLRFSHGLLERLADVHEYTKPLTILMYRVCYVVFVDLGGLEPASAFALMISVAGVIGCWGLVRLSGLLARSQVERAILIIGSLAAAPTILFFGWVEHYTFGTAMLLWWLVALVLYYRGIVGWGRFFVATVALLLFNMLFAPVIFLLLLKPRDAGTPESSPVKYMFPVTSLHLLAFAILLSVGMAALIHDSDVRLSIVPLWPKPFNQYWFLSVGHLTDQFNLLLHIAPIGVLAIVVAAIRRQGFPNSESKLIAMAAALLAIASFWLDAMLGEARDWDLLSMFGFPMTIAGLLFLLPANRSHVLFGRLAVQCFLIVALVLVPGLIEKQNLQTAVSRLDNILKDSPHYQAGYRRGRDLSSWAWILSDQAGRADLAEKYIYRRVEAAPDSPLGWFNLGQAALNRHRPDSAVQFFQRCYNLAPQVDKYRIQYATALQQVGQTSEAYELVRGLDQRAIDDLELLRNLGIIMGAENRFEEAIPYFRRAYSLSPTTCIENYNLGLSLLQMRALDSALVYMMRAVDLCDTGSDCDLVQTVTILQIELKNWPAAREWFDKYVAECPGASDIETIRSLMASASR